MDPTVTPAERVRIIDVMMSGKPNCTEPLERDVTIAFAADYLGMSRTTLWRMCSNGKIACDRRGKKFYIKSSEIVRMRKSIAA